jgi:hypothetical protein
VGAARTKKKLAVRGDSGVVSDVDGAFEAAFEFSAKIHTVETWKIGKVAEDAGGQFNRPGAADANPEEVAGVFGDEPTDGPGHVVEDGGGAVVNAGRQVDGFQRLALRCDGGGAEIGAAEVHADGEGGHESTIIREGEATQRPRNASGNARGIFGVAEHSARRLKGIEYDGAGDARFAAPRS